MLSIKKVCVRELFCAAGDHAIVHVVIHVVVIRSLPAAFMAIFRKRNSQHIAFCQKNMKYDYYVCTSINKCIYIYILVFFSSFLYRRLPFACSNAALMHGVPRQGALSLWKERQAFTAKARKHTLLVVRPRPAAPSLRQHRRQTPAAAGLQEVRTGSSGAGQKQIAAGSALELPGATAAR